MQNDAIGAIEFAAFDLKNMAPPKISIAQIDRSSIPFLLLQVIGLTLCIVFPEVVLWLPRMVHG